MHKAAIFKQQIIIVERTPSIGIKEAVGDEFQKTLTDSFQKTESTQTNIPISAKMIEQLGLNLNRNGKKLHDFFSEWYGN